MGQRWRYRIQTGLSAWLPASDAIVMVSQQVFSIQEPAVGVSLGVSFEFQ
jgi:hypothetical protein